VTGKRVLQQSKRTVFRSTNFLKLLLLHVRREFCVLIVTFPLTKALFNKKKFTHKFSPADKKLFPTFQKSSKKNGKINYKARVVFVNFFFFHIVNRHSHPNPSHNSCMMSLLINIIKEHVT
jgi:hypothetical protein